MIPENKRLEITFPFSEDKMDNKASDCSVRVKRQKQISNEPPPPPKPATSPIYQCLMPRGSSSQAAFPRVRGEGALSPRGSCQPRPRTLFDARGRAQLPGLDLLLGEMQRRRQQLRGLHVQHQLLHPPAPRRERAERRPASRSPGSGHPPRPG